MTLVKSNISADPSLLLDRYTDCISNLTADSDSLLSKFPAIFKQQLLNASVIQDDSNLLRLFHQTRLMIQFNSLLSRYNFFSRFSKILYVSQSFLQVKLRIRICSQFLDIICSCSKHNFVDMKFSAFWLLEEIIIKKNISPNYISKQFLCVNHSHLHVSNVINTGIRLRYFNFEPNWKLRLCCAWNFDASQTPVTTRFVLRTSYMQYSYLTNYAIHFDPLENIRKPQVLFLFLSLSK